MSVNLLNWNDSLILKDTSVVSHKGTGSSELCSLAAESNNGQNQMWQCTHIKQWQPLQHSITPFRMFNKLSRKPLFPPFRESYPWGRKRSPATDWCTSCSGFSDPFSMEFPATETNNRSGLELQGHHYCDRLRQIKILKGSRQNLFLKKKIQPWHYN